MNWEAIGAVGEIVGAFAVIATKRLDRPEWQHTQDYWREKDDIPAIDLDAEEFLYD